MTCIVIYLWTQVMILCFWYLYHWKNACIFIHYLYNSDINSWIYWWISMGTLHVIYTCYDHLISFTGWMVILCECTITKIINTRRIQYSIGVTRVSVHVVKSKHFFQILHQNLYKILKKCFFYFGVVNESYIEYIYPSQNIGLQVTFFILQELNYLNMWRSREENNFGPLRINMENSFRLFILATFGMWMSEISRKILK